MKISLFIIVNLLLIHLGFSQEENSKEFIGALHTSTNEIISYKLKFHELKDGRIEGESQTDFYGANNTKSKVTGSMDSKGKRVSFSEINNITSKSEEDEQTFCFVRVNDLKIRKNKTKSIIQGSFYGAYSTGDTCATGTIYLVSAALLTELNIGEDSLRKMDSLMSIAKVKMKPNYLRNKDTLTFQSLEKKIVLNIWDGSKEDNDMINIYFNDQLLEKNLVITNDKKKITIPYTSEKGTLKIVAMNEGDLATNTVNFLLQSGSNNNAFTSVLKKGEEVIIQINK